MEFLFNTENNITVFEVGLLLLLNATASFFGKTKVAMLVNLFFTLYWGFFLNFDMLFGKESTSEYSTIFFVFAIVIIIFTVIGLTRDDD